MPGLGLWQTGNYFGGRGKLRYEDQTMGNGNKIPINKGDYEM